MDIRIMDIITLFKSSKNLQNPSYNIRRLFCSAGLF